MYWDGEETPSVEAPLGDFFLAGNTLIRRVNSVGVSINPGVIDGTWGLSMYLPMPFATGARIELCNEGEKPFGPYWYHIEYEKRDAIGPEMGRLHAQYRQETPTQAKCPEELKNSALADDSIPNLDGAENYVIADIEGAGHIVGMLLNVDNRAGGWWGEGDDMIFIDGEPWPPRYHGTGSEEVFGGGACPNKEYTSLYTGFHCIENTNAQGETENHAGKNGMYRWYIQDPIRFEKHVRMTIEHGHANNYESDYSSVVYWYQQEPHAPFPAFPSVVERTPNLPEGLDALECAMEALRGPMHDSEGDLAKRELAARLAGEAATLKEERNYAEALAKVEEAMGLFG